MRQFLCHIDKNRFSAQGAARYVFLRPRGLDTAPEPPRVHAVVAGKVPAKSRDPRRDFRPKPRPGEKRGPHIDRHPMGRCRCFLSQIVDGHTNYDTRSCGSPIGSKRSQKRLSSVILACFWPFSQRDAAQSLPSLLLRVDRLLWPFFVSGSVAQGCPRVELRAKNPKN